MTLQCYNVLHNLRKLTNKSTTPFLPSYYQDSFSLQNKPDSVYKCPEYEHEFSSILESLVENGYIKQSSGSFYCLTHKGIHPYQFTIDTVIHVFFTSILCPIVVSFITTLITLSIFG